jgi:hypothetical protein
VAVHWPVSSSVTLYKFITVFAFYLRFTASVSAFKQINENKPDASAYVHGATARDGDCEQPVNTQDR